MDIFAHALWASAGATKLNNSLEKKEESKISILWSALWSIFPDLFAFSIPLFLLVIQIIWSGKSLVDISHNGTSFLTNNPDFNLAIYLYQYSHSIIIFLLVFGIVWLIYKRPALPMLGWLLHIIIDIPSHSINFFPTPFLFPISSYHFAYGVAWSNTTFMIVNYSLLLIVCIYLFLKKKKAPIL